MTQVGPVAEWSPRVHDDEPTVLVSLSTFAFAGMTGALQRLLAATRGLDARVVVTTGPAVDPARPGASRAAWRCTGSSRTAS